MLKERFIELLTKQLSSEISDDEFREFQELLASDEANMQQYEVFKDFWAQKDQGYHDSALMFDKIKNRIAVDEEPADNVRLLVAKKRYALWRSIAAAVIILFCGLIWYNRKTLASRFPGKNIALNLDSTVVKPQVRSIITLTDGTRVTLNSESKLKYPDSFSGETREVYLAGEAFFDVFKDSKHPFIIHTGKMNIKVLGTAFNVRAYPKDLTSETTLLRGVIEVTLNDRPSDRIILKAEDKLILRNDAVTAAMSLQHKPLTNSNDNKTYQYSLNKLTYLDGRDTSVLETSWLKNKLVFRNEDFVTLAQRLQRWYGVNIIFNNKLAKEYRFSGSYEKETIDQALNALKITEKFDYKIDGSNVFIY